MTDIIRLPDLDLNEKNTFIMTLTPEEMRKINLDKSQQYLTFGGRMNWIRYLNSLPANKTAELIGVAPSTLRSYEEDKTVPLPETIGRFCKVFQVKDEWLMSGNGDVFRI
ncbi:MAG: helix-turn-helix transcriptional regulator [Clostridia bacterium]|nr:helix-turn-helix transcriptional regulator [Clostridia bacterium]